MLKTGGTEPPTSRLSASATGFRKCSGLRKNFSRYSNQTRGARLTSTVWLGSYAPDPRDRLTSMRRRRTGSLDHGQLLGRARRRGHASDARERCAALLPAPPCREASPAGPGAGVSQSRGRAVPQSPTYPRFPPRSEEHTSELQSPCNLVCRLLLEKKKHLQQGRPVLGIRHRQRHTPP